MRAITMPLGDIAGTQAPLTASRAGPLVAYIQTMAGRRRASPVRAPTRKYFNTTDYPGQPSSKLTEGIEAEAIFLITVSCSGSV